MAGGGVELNARLVCRWRAPVCPFLSPTRLCACAVEQAVAGSLQLPYQGQTLDFEAPFRRATMHDLVRDACGVDFEQFGSADVEVRAGSSVQ